MSEGDVFLQLSQTVPQVFDIVVRPGGLIVGGDQLFEDLVSVPPAAQLRPDPAPACPVGGDPRLSHGYLMTARGTARCSRSAHQAISTSSRSICTAASASASSSSRPSVTEWRARTSSRSPLNS